MLDGHVIEGAVVSPTVTVVLSQVEFPQDFSHRAQYVVVSVGESITRGLPVPTDPTPHEVVYQPTVVPDPPVTDRLMSPESLGQKLSRSLCAELGGIGGVQQEAVEPLPAVLSAVATFSPFCACAWKS
jgi:hypothetical protein